MLKDFKLAIVYLDDLPVSVSRPDGFLASEAPMFLSSAR
jgi:hypothetical protein